MSKTSFALPEEDAVVTVHARERRVVLTYAQLAQFHASPDLFSAFVRALVDNPQFTTAQGLSYAAGMLSQLSLAFSTRTDFPKVDFVPPTV